MSTRGLLGVIADNEFVVGTYNHFDSYSEGLGVDVIQFCDSFLKSKKDINND